MNPGATFCAACGKDVPSAPPQAHGQAPTAHAHGQPSAPYGQAPSPYSQPQPGYGQPQPGYGQPPPGAPYAVPYGAQHGAPPPGGAYGVAPPGGPQLMVVAAQRTSGMAIAGFVLSFLCGLLGLIFSIIGYNECKNSNGTVGGGGLALAGIIISIASMVIGLAMVGAR